MIIDNDEDNNFDNVDEHGVAPGQGGGGVRRGQDRDGGDHWGSQHHCATDSARHFGLPDRLGFGLSLEKDRVNADQQVGGDLGEGEEEPLPLPLLPLIGFEGGGKGECGVRR